MIAENDRKTMPMFRHTTDLNVRDISHDIWEVS